MVNCDFCGASIEKGTGKMFIRDSGKIINFCSTKCEKFMLKYKKKPRNLKYTTIYHNEKKGVKK